MSLTDGTAKMSKSDPVEGSRINLTDPPDVINKKVMMSSRAVLLLDRLHTAEWHQHRCTLVDVIGCVALLRQYKHFPSLRALCRRLLWSYQLRKCKTDMYQGLEWDNPDRPECTNLLTIYQVRTCAMNCH